MGSTGAALAALPGVAAEAEPPSAPWPLTAEAFPLASPDPVAVQVLLKLVVAGEAIDQAHHEKLKAIAPTLNIMACRTPEPFRQEVSNAHIVFGSLSREDFLAAEQLRWIQFLAAGVESIPFRNS